MMTTGSNGYNMTGFQWSPPEKESFRMNMNQTLSDIKDANRTKNVSALIPGEVSAFNFEESAITSVDQKKETDCPNESELNIDIN